MFIITWAKMKTSTIKTWSLIIRNAHRKINPEIKTEPERFFLLKVLTIHFVHAARISPVQVALQSNRPCRGFSLFHFPLLLKENIPRPGSSRHFYSTHKIQRCPE